MFCDDLITNVGKRAKNRDLAVPVDVMSEKVIQPIRVAQRFVLSPLVVETIDQLADPEKVESTRDHLFTPAHYTWIEWREGSVGWGQSNRHGLLLLGEGPITSSTSLVVGQGLYAFDVRNTDFWPEPSILYFPITYDLVSGKLLSLVNDNNSLVDYKTNLPPSLRNEVAVEQLFDQLTWTKNEIVNQVDQEKLGAFLGAALALINTPRLSQRTLMEPNPKLQSAREKKGKLPLLSWHEINLMIDRGELGHGEPLTQTGEKAFHHVRTHLRLKRGKVEIVRPHWRGNPEKGVILHKHVVSRVEDEAGEWKGGPLPFPKIIKEFS